MVALAVWFLAVGVADLVAGTRDPDATTTPRRGWATATLMALALLGGLGIGLSWSGTVILTIFTALSGGAWVSLRRPSLALAVMGTSVVVMLTTAGLWVPEGRGVLQALDRTMLAPTHTPQGCPVC